MSEGHIWAPESVTGDQHLTADAVVVGSGAGGAVVAAALARAGLKVVILEEGPYVPTEAFGPDARKAMPTLYRNGGSTMIDGNSPVLFTEGRCVGGSTVVNAGICFRAPDAVLQSWVAEGLTAMAPEAIAPYYARVEQVLGVTEVPRTLYSGDARRLELAAERLGYRTARVRRNAPDCVGTNMCILGCPTGAKRSTLVTYLPEAIAAGAQLIPRCRATSVKTRRRGGRVQACGIEARMLDADDCPRQSVSVEAAVVVLSGGALQTPQLLFRSDLNTRHRTVGEKLFLHPNCKMIGLFDEETRGWQGTVQGLQIDHFADEGYTFFSTFVPPGLMAFGLPLVGDAAFEVMEHYNRLASWGVLIEDGHPGRVFPGTGSDPRAVYRFDEQDRQRIIRGLQLLAGIFFAAEARRVFLPLHKLPEIRHPEQIAWIPNAAAKIADIELLTVHAMSTCRMSADPSRGVVDSGHEHHDVAGLFISDASVLPGPLRINPMLTIMALAERCAEQILERKFGRAAHVVPSV